MAHDIQNKVLLAKIDINSLIRTLYRINDTTFLVGTNKSFIYGLQLLINQEKPTFNKLFINSLDDLNDQEVWSIIEYPLCVQN